MSDAASSPTSDPIGPPPVLEATPDSPPAAAAPPVVADPPPAETQVDEPAPVTQPEPAPIDPPPVAQARFVSRLEQLTDNVEDKVDAVLSPVAKEAEHLAADAVVGVEDVGNAVNTAEPVIVEASKIIEDVFPAAGPLLETVLNLTSVIHDHVNSLDSLVAELRGLKI